LNIDNKKETISRNSKSITTSLEVTPPKPIFKFHELSHKNPQKTIQKYKKRKQEIEITQKDDCESRRARKRNGTS
jgi:hypothetical protein